MKDFSARRKLVPILRVQAVNAESDALIIGLKTSMSRWKEILCVLRIGEVRDCRCFKPIESPYIPIIETTPEPSKVADVT